MSTNDSSGNSPQRGSILERIRAALNSGVGDTQEQPTTPTSRLSERAAHLRLITRPATSGADVRHFSPLADVAGDTGETVTTTRRSRHHLKLVPNIARRIKEQESGETEQGPPYRMHRES